MCHTPNGNIWHNLDASTKGGDCTGRMILLRRPLAGEGGVPWWPWVRGELPERYPLDGQAVGLPSEQACGQFLLG